jgi:hypothetical protein
MVFKIPKDVIDEARFAAKSFWEGFNAATWVVLIVLFFAIKIMQIVQGS